MIQGRIRSIGAAASPLRVPMFTAAAIGAALFAAPTLAQLCKIQPFRKYFEPENIQFQAFASSLAARGDAVLAGEPKGPGAVAFAGRAVALAIQPDGSVIRTQNFWASDGAANQLFGASIAINAAGDVAVVGAPGDPAAGAGFGAAYVFRLHAGVWTQEAKLKASDGAAGDAFGSAVAISGGFIVVGAPTADLPAAANAGAAYVYSYGGVAWSQSQKLTAASPAANDRFGASVSLTSQRLAAGAPQRTVSGQPNRGSVFTFQLQAGTWMPEPELIASDGAADDQFGFSVSLDADRIAVSAPNDDDQVSNGGSAWVFKSDGIAWQPESKIIPADSFANSGASSIVVLDGDRLAIGRPNTKVAVLHDGAVSVARFSGGTWSEAVRLVATPAGDANARLGSSVAFAEAGAYVCSGAPSDTGSHVNNGALHFYKPFEDCDGDGVFDACGGGDCDFNRIPDSCEIDSGLQTDCDGDGALDLCQAQDAYRLDDGDSEGAVFVVSSVGADALWMNQFNVLPGFNTIDAVGLAWTRFAPPGVPITVVVYKDPDNDGDPHDAMLLTAVPWVVEDAHQMNPPYPSDFVRIRIPPTYVGPDGASFFVGAMMSQEASSVTGGYGPAAYDNTAPHMQRSWFFYSPIGQMDLNDIGAAPDIDFLSGLNLLVRAYAVDADVDGLPDICAACPSDVTGDGMTDIDDLFAVINAWGACPDPRDCPADIAPAGGDDVVDVDDLFAVINAWGSCP